MCIDHLARRHSIETRHRHCRSRVGAGRIGGVDVVLAKPLTYMNASGEAVSLLVDRYRVAPEDILVVHDDIDLPLGRIRLRPSGGSGGHKGLKSIIEALGTEGFARLRLGIGRPSHEKGHEAVVGYVLGDFSPEEKRMVEGMLERAATAVERFVTAGIMAAMNEFNAPPAVSPGTMTDPPVFQEGGRSS